MDSEPRVTLVGGDITQDFEREVLSSGRVACDIETSGLDWRCDRMATFQLHVSGVGAEIVKLDGGVPNRLRMVMENGAVVKVFHHAPFDLRFIRYHWGVRLRNVSCTKILMKILHPGLNGEDYSLKPLLSEYLGVEINKDLQASDWLSETLSSEQLRYAARDVQFLLTLFDRLMIEAEMKGLGGIVDETFRYLPVRVDTDIRGCGDIFSY